jgi:hypothetical protein
MVQYISCTLLYFFVSLRLYRFYYVYVNIKLYIIYVLKAMFIVCSSFIFSVARLWKPFISSYSAHPTGPWVSDRHYVSVVLRYLFIYRCPYMPRCVVDRVGDSCIESFVVHPLYILMLVGPGLEEEDSVSNFPKLMFLMWHNLAMITRYN